MCDQYYGHPGNPGLESKGCVENTSEEDYIVLNTGSCYLWLLASKPVILFVSKELTDTFPTLGTVSFFGHTVFCIAENGGK